MVKKTKFLVIIGILIGIGAALLFVGSQSITADIIIEEGQIDKTNSIRINAFLDPEINSEGVFAVQTLDATQEKISAIVTDPNGKILTTSSINQNSFEKIFDIYMDGEYILEITTESNEPINVVGGIGHVPDSGLYSISIAGFLLLLSGMIGVVVVGIMLVKERRKKLS
tara:strand:+ start:88 stop:594 length:507 start_codon:yes stop_codon:yes gene_type:complete